TSRWRYVLPYPLSLLSTETKGPLSLSLIQTHRNKRGGSCGAAEDPTAPGEAEATTAAHGWRWCGEAQRQGGAAWRWWRWAAAVVRRQSGEVVRRR
ncbi:hypothetical protein EE612_038145, partial [Oryza sativa]